VYPCCQSYMLNGAPVGNIRTQGMPAIFNGGAMQELRRQHAAGEAAQIPMCSRCRTTIPHPLLVAGSLIFHGETVRKLLPLVERLAYFLKLPRRLLTPQRPVPVSKDELVQIK